MKARENIRPRINTKKSPDGVRERLLEASRRLFAEHGYAGTSTNDVVAAARCNKRMLFHYFGDKEGLYREIFRGEWSGLWKKIAPLTAAASDATQITAANRLRAALESFSDHLEEHPAFVRFLMWEALEGGHLSRALWKDVRGPFFREVRDLIDAAAAAGELRKGIDATQLIISFLGMVTFYFSYASTLEDLIEEKVFSAPALVKRRHQVRLVLDALLT